MLQSLLSAPTEAVLAVAAGWTLTYAAHSTVALGLAWLADGRTRWTRTPRARSMLWTGAVAASLLSATVQTATGLGPRVDLEVAEAEKVVAEFRPDGAASAGRGAAAQMEPATLHRPHEAERLDPLAWYRALGHDWPFLLAGIWLLGALISLSRGAAGLKFLRTTLADRTRITGGRARRILDELAARAGLEDRVRLSRSPALAGPVALPGREICLPDRALRGLDGDELRAVLAHELAHVVRRDSAVMLAMEAVRRCLFFQPLLGLARERVEQTAEACSDLWVRDLGLGVPLADSLLLAARRMKGDRDRVRMAGLARTGKLDDRVRRLLEPASPVAAPGTPARSILPALGLTVAVLFASAPAARIATPAHASAIAPHRGGQSLPAVTETATGAGALEVVARHTGAAPSDLPPRHRSLAARDGGTLLVRLPETSGPVSVALRPGGEEIRLVGPRGRERRLKPPPDLEGRAWTASLRVRRSPPGRYELHLPSSIERLALEAGDRAVASEERLRGGELPQLIQLR